MQLTKDFEFLCLVDPRPTLTRDQHIVTEEDIITSVNALSCVLASSLPVLSR